MRPKVFYQVSENIRERNGLHVQIADNMPTRSINFTRKCLAIMNYIALISGHQPWVTMTTPETRRMPPTARAWLRSIAEEACSPSTALHLVTYVLHVPSYVRRVLLTVWYNLYTCMRCAQFQAVILCSTMLFKSANKKVFLLGGFW